MKLVVLTPGGKYYYGILEGDGDDKEAGAYADYEAWKEDTSRSLYLTEVWQMLELQQPIRERNGDFLGVNTTVTLIPLFGLKGPLKQITTSATTVFDVKDNGLEDLMTAMVKAVEASIELAATGIEMVPGTSPFARKPGPGS
jgi:hypothetical protein